MIILDRAYNKLNVQLKILVSKAHLYLKYSKLNCQLKHLNKVNYIVIFTFLVSKAQLDT